MVMLMMLLLKKGEGKENVGKILKRTLLFFIPLTEEKDIVHSLFFVRKNFVKNLIEIGRRDFVVKKVVKS